MNNDILKVADMYAEGLKDVQHRRDMWLKKHEEVKAHLKEVADFLNANAQYKMGFYVDALRAFNEDINGTCAELPSISFRTGDMPMLVHFKNNMGERKEYMESGFQINFTPIITGQIIVLLYPHHSDLSVKEMPPITIAVIDDLEEMKMEDVDTIIAKGMETAFYTSFTGIVSRQEVVEQEAEAQAPRYNPIGFKRYETTEEVKEPSNMAAKSKGTVNNSK